MMLIFIHFSPQHFPSDSKSLSRLPSFPQQGLAAFLYGRSRHFLLVPREMRDSPAPGAYVMETEKPRDGGTMPGAAAKPGVLTGTSNIVAEQGAPKQKGSSFTHYY